MAKYCIGVDLGGTFIKFGLLDQDYKPSKTFQLPTPDTSADDIVAQMVVGAKKAMEEHGLKKKDIVGVGVGAPGPMKISEGIIIASPNLPTIRDFPMARKVADGVGLPTVLENDANAAGFGEYVAGAGKGGGDMVLLTLGTGVGGGIVVNGKVLHGAHEIGAEIGHLIVEPGGEPCGCGQRGCLERYASATFMAQFAERVLKAGGTPSKLKAVLDAKGELDAKDINEARKAGDELAAEVWDRSCYYLALGCVSISRLLDPELIVLAGGLIKAGDDLLKPVQAHFRKHHWKLTDVKTRIAFSTLGTDAGVIGAAGVAWAELGKN
jgi:glucokinase